MSKERILTIKENDNDESIIIEVIPVEDPLNDIERKLNENARKLDEIDKNIDRLTNKSDLLNYSIAIGSGVISGLIDAFFVGDFSLENAKNWGMNNIDKTLMKKFPSNSLNNAIKKAEKNYRYVGDFAAKEFGDGDHHFYEFGHHKSPLGLISSIITQFTGKTYGIDPTTGVFKSVSISNFQSSLQGKTISEKLLNAILNWNGHLISDMAGSSSARKAGNNGSGIPGPIMSSLIEFSSLPIFKGENGTNEFNKWLFDLYNGEVIKGYNMNYRMEKGILHETSKQFLPVTINEFLVRFYYFIRRFTEIVKREKIRNIKDIKPEMVKETLPYNNRAITRMLTISSGVMTAIDLTDALIRSKGTLTGFALRINYVGIGRFAIAISSECISEYKKNISLKERMSLIEERNKLLNKKTYILNKDNFIQIENNEKEIKQIENIINDISINLPTIHKENEDDLNDVSSSIDKMKDNNNDLLDDMKDILDW